MDTGFQSRMNILTSDFQRSTVPLLESHGWVWEIEDTVEQGEYLIIKIYRGNWTKRFAILYSQQTRKEVYSVIQQRADACLIHGMNLDPNCSFSLGFSKPLELASNFINILKDWNKECPTEEVNSPQKDCRGCVKTPIKIYLTAENPSEQYWMLIKTLKSSEVCKRFLTERYPDLSSEVIKSKSEGVAFLMQNSCDYFDSAQTQNPTQRLLNLYYGTLALIEADILMNSDKYTDLKAVEEITKGGHGLYIYIPENDYSINSLYTCILKNGLFAKWLNVLDYDTNDFPEKRIRKDDELNKYCYLFNDILARIPELAVLMRMINPEYSTGFLEPHYSDRLNQKSSITSRNPGYTTQNEGSYISLVDKSGCSNLDMVKTLIGNIEQVSENRSERDQFDENDDGRTYKRYSIFVKHSPDSHWYQHLNLYKSSYCLQSIIIPLSGLKDDWIVYAVMILYTFSIIVRYYPNLWRRMQDGEWDKYYTVCLQFAMIVEKIVPHIFYEKLTGQKLHVSSSIW